MSPLVPTKHLHMGPPTTRREPRQTREGATVAESECGGPTTFLSFGAGFLSACGNILAAGGLRLCCHRPSSSRMSRSHHQPSPTAPPRPHPCGWLLLCVCALLAAKAHALELQPLLGPLATGLPQALPAAAPALAPAAEAPPYPYLPDDPTEGSFSIGTTSNGRLVRAAVLTENERLQILPIQRQRDLRYGSDALVAALQHAAAELFRQTHTRLWVGNLGKRYGGDIRYSVSHNSGRDADIAFAYQDLKGHAVDPPDLVPLNGLGLAPKKALKFDTARTWLIVKALLQFKGAQVQYLFISGSLRELLLNHARKQKEPATLIQRAAHILRQPGASAPHNDHLHLRIYCGAQDISGGCVDGGIFHDWVPRQDQWRSRRSQQAAAFLKHAQAHVREAALQRLVLLRASDYRDDIRQRLADPHAGVRTEAARAIAALGKKRDAEALALRFAAEPELGVRIALLDAAAALPSRASGELLASAVGSPHLPPAPAPPLAAADALRGPALLGLLAQRASDIAPGPHSDSWRTLDEWFGGTLLRAARDAYTQQLAAIDAAAKAERLEPVQPLVAMLSDRDPIIRTRAAKALRLITNFAYGIDWADGSQLMQNKGRERWRAAYDRSRTAARSAWLVTGFRAAGYKVRSLHREAMWELVRAIVGGDHTSFNAQRTLMRITKHHPPTLTWSKNDACQYWLRWVRARRSRYKLKKPPRNTVNACYAPAR